ncbi:hypothetical protein AAFC00_000745 [Neodothiora populina]|uniref:Uncharacterized protein n=1 Tax=Neodothiora populina TaxID=2781224 RepID=A0ABR3PDW1_9PEZI
MKHYLTVAVLLLASTYGTYALFGFGYKNGLLALVQEQLKSGHVADGVAAEVTSPTGIASADEQLAGLLTFFWPVLDGSRPDVSLHCLYFGGQCIAMWTITAIEGLRAGNRGRMVACTTIYGLLFQTIGIAVAAPLYLVLHLATSPTATNPMVANSQVNSNELQALPFSTITGFIIPSIFMSLHAPSYLTWDMKAYAILLWQFFPLWCYLSQWVWKRLFTIRSVGPRSHHLDPDRNLMEVRNMRKVYFFAVACTAIIHIGVWSVSVAAFMFPSSFAEGLAPSLVPSRLFVPTGPWSSVKADSIATGAHWLLQWDLVISSSAYLLWACYMAFNTKAKTENIHGYFQDAFAMLLKVSLLGLAGAAAYTIWERDELVYSENPRQRTYEQASRKTL